MKHRFSCRWGLLLLVFALWPVLAQEASTDSTSMRDVLETEEAKARLMEEKAGDTALTAADADTPLAAVLGITKAFDDGEFAAAAEFLDLRYLPDEIAAEWTPVDLIRALDVVWGQNNVLDITSVSDDPRGHLDDGLPEYRDSLGIIKLKGEDVPVFLQIVPDGSGGKVWKVSNATVARIPDMWDEWGYSDLAVYLLRVLPPFTLFDMQNWQLLLLVVFFVLAWPASILVSTVLMKIALRIPNRFPKGIERFFRGPIRFFVFILLARTLSDHLSLSLQARITLESSGIDYIAATVLIMGVLSLLRDYEIRKLQRTGNPHFAALLTPITTIVKVLVLIGIGLIWADAAGYNMTTILAGLGVGSLAVALAAQKTLENLIGAITLYVAQPVKPGDFCRFGETVGTVEEIGLRSTTLRTLNRTLVMIPNAVFAAAEVENYTARDRIRFFRYLRVQTGSPDQLRFLLAGVKRLLLSHARVQQDSVSVRLEKVEDATAMLRIDGGVMTQDFQDYLAVAEDLNLQILELVEYAGLQLAGPAQTVLLHQQEDIDREQAARVEQTVAEWRQQDRLPFPEYSDAEVSEMKGSLEYPASGMAAPKQQQE